MESTTVNTSTVLLGYTSCSAGKHHQGEGSDECNAANGDNGAFGSKAVYGSYWDCTELPEDTNYAPSDPPSDEGGGSTSNSGSTTYNPTYECIEVPVDPTDPSFGIGDDGGCEIGVPTLPNLGGSPNDPNIPCNKLKNLLNPSKANLKPYITSTLYDFIDAYPDIEGEAGKYLKRNSTGYLSYDNAPFTITNSLPAKWGNDYYCIIHTHPENAYPMFSYSDMIAMYKLEVDSSTHNNGKSSFLLVCTVNGVKQTYAIVFENAGLLMEDVWAKPEYAGLTIKEKIEALNKELKDMYTKEGKKSNPDYERVFLKFNFGTNLGLYKANGDLTNWTKLTIANDSDTVAVTHTNCN